ncbi:hypothetical protein INT45_009022 [Circinella minor]|uniref:Cytochrome P450 n=1 Tax=Circinella minor TaxID=1195481 RepID=A0A8H7VMT3_9FUNG|nr:hypothetical protein INT45_009022 [Circinella minor]
MSTSGSRENLVTAAAIVSGCFLGTAALLAYKYPNSAIFEDIQKGIPQVKGYPLVGSFFQQLQGIKRYYDMQHEQLENLGTMTMITSAIFISPTITTVDPVNINYILKTNYTNYNKDTHLKNCTKKFCGDGLFVNDGAKWRYHRKTASRVFGTKNIQKCFDRVFVKDLKVVTRRVLDQYASTGASIDIQELMLKFTMNSFIQIGFGKDLQILTEKDVVPLGESFDLCMDHIADLYMNPFTPIIDIINTIFHPQTKHIQQHYDELKTFANNVISERREDVRNGKKFDDLLSQFMNTTDEHGESFSNEDLCNMMLGTISAGRETTAASIAWTMYSIIKNPTVEAKLLAEIDYYFPDTNYQEDLDPTKLFDTIKNMKYAHAVLHESLRLHPPIPINQRVAVENDIWPDGSVIRKGNVVSWNMYAQARCSKIWGDNCHEFNPERWILEDGSLYKEAKGQAPVFNVGPRTCLGDRLAIVEGLVVLITLVRRYKFSFSNPEQKNDYNVRVVETIKGGLPVHVQKRY